MLFVHSGQFSDVLLVDFVYLVSSWLLVRGIGSVAYLAANNCKVLHVWRQENEASPVPEEDGGQFEAIEEEPEVDEVVEGPKGLMLLEVEQGVDGVIIFHGVLDEAFPVLDEYPQFLGVGQRGLLKAARNEDDIAASLHEGFHILLVDGFNSPQPKE